MKKYFSFLSTMLLCFCLIGITSCIGDTNSSATYSMNGSFTVTGTYPSYTLVGDNGTIVKLTPESVSKTTDSKGFGDIKRIQAWITYNEDNLTFDANKVGTINKAELQSAAAISINKIYNNEAANEANILAADSIFDITSLQQAWVVNGYLSTYIVANYTVANGKGIAPSVNILVKDENIKQNEVTFTLLYNRHSSKNVTPGGTTNFLHSFTVSDMNIPGSDSIKVNIEAQGINTASFKIDRKALIPIR